MSCPDCTTGANLPGTPKGVIKDDGSYFAAAPKGGEGSEHKRAVLLLTDAFGLGLDNPKIMADYFAEQLHCDVWVPDIWAGEDFSVLMCLLIKSLSFDDSLTPLCAGKPLIKESELKMPEKAGEKIGFLGWSRFYMTMLPKIGKIISNRPSVVDKRIKNVRQSNYPVTFFLGF